jgi:hypothetical protein
VSGDGGGGGIAGALIRSNTRRFALRRGSSRESRIAGLITDRASSFIFASAALAIHGHTDDRIYTSSTCTRIQHQASQFMNPERGERFYSSPRDGAREDIIRKCRKCIIHSISI